mgnify:CR=1 FL=1
MIKTINFEIKEFNNIKQKIDKLHYIGNANLLKKRKISIVGTRRPSNYTKLFTHKISSELSSRDITIVSGAAMGVDAISHRASHNFNTIAVVANGLNIRYPSVNKKLIESIEENGLMLSQFDENEKARNMINIKSK